MKTYCNAKESLTIKAILIGLQTLSESSKCGDRTLGDVFGRFVQNSVDFIKRDKVTQEEVITYLTNDSRNCNNAYL